MQGKKVVTAKRPSDAAATTTGLASAAAAVAAPKLARSSLSSGRPVPVDGQAGRRLACHATCDEMPSDGPSEDPTEGKERTDEHGPEFCITNGVPRTITAAAARAPGVIMEACDEDEEEEDDEEDE